MDTSLFFLINHGLQNGILDIVMPFVTKHADIFIGLVILISIIKDKQKGFVVLILCVTGLIVADMSGNMLKHLFERPRPCQGLDEVRLLIGCGRAFSFPSNHAVNSFAIAAIFSHFFRRAAFPMFFAALLVAFSRVYVGVHYPSDVIAGAVWGLLAAGLVITLHAWSSKRFNQRPYDVVFLIFILSITLFRYYYLALGNIGLSPDEAHYWEWSRRLDLSYYSKGPFIAYVMAFSTWLMGDTVFGVRFFAPLFLAFSSLFIYLLTIELYTSPDIPETGMTGPAQGREARCFAPRPVASPRGPLLRPEASEGAGRRAACCSALVFQVIPLFSVFGIVNTTDSPLLFFWTLSLYLFWKAIQTQCIGIRDQGSGKKKKIPVNSQLSTVNCLYWFLLGCAVGFGLLAKYAMAFFYMCGFLFLVSSGRNRSWLKRKEPYLALVLSVLIFSPVIYWNAGHDWVALRHAAGQAHVLDGLKISLKDFFEFFGSQVGVLTPVLFFFVMYGSIRNYISRFTARSSQFLFWFWFPVLGIFLIKSLQGKVQANWAMFAYITALIASADFYLKGGPLKKGLRVVIVIALLIAFSVTAVAHYPTVLNLPVRMDPSARFRGWEELGIRAGEVYEDMASRKEEKVFIFSDRYQVSSELAFYLPGKPRVYYVNIGRRMNQYDIWGGLDGLTGYDAVFVMKGDTEFPEELERSFNSHEKTRFTVKENERVLRKYSIFRCYGFKGLVPKEIERY
jgi:undecaprenyl-diphosphatase